jgi:hypothetical protein
MPQDVVSDLPPIEKEQAYPARFDMSHWDDRFPNDVLDVAYPVAEAFEIATQRWGKEEAGTFTPLKNGGDLVKYPQAEKFIPEPK